MSELLKVYNALGMTRTRRSPNEVRVYTTHCELNNITQLNAELLTSKPILV